MWTLIKDISVFSVYVDWEGVQRLPWVKYEREKGKGGDNINFDMFHNAQLIDIRCYLCGPSQ